MKQVQMQHFKKISKDSAKSKLILPYKIIKYTLLLKFQWEENDIIITPYWKGILFKIPEEFLNNT